MSNTINVYIVEDQPADMCMILEALSENGIEMNVLTASDGKEALDFLLSNQPFVPSLIILDLNLPKVTGQEVLKRIRKDDRVSRIPVIILTSLDEEKYINEMYDSCVNGYMIKPDDYFGYKDKMKYLKDFWFKAAKLPPIG
tara:strand:- start:3777 stop:4199 length:423 start_codon:yes stop_codon:yes gene_type:complete